MSSSYTDSELDSSEYTTATETETEDEVRGFKFIILVFLKNDDLNVSILIPVYIKLMTSFLWAYCGENQNFRVWRY